MHHVSKREIRAYTNCIGVHENKIFVQIIYNVNDAKFGLVWLRIRTITRLPSTYYMFEAVQTINKAMQRANNITIIRIQM